MKKYQEIIERCKNADKRYWAGDNIARLLQSGDKEQLIDEATEAFETVLDTLIIDRHTDPNSKGTARRLAKMYFNEIMAGRYDYRPDATAFPNEPDDITNEKYDGMLVVRSELKSMCSHHHQPVTGVAYIGILSRRHTYWLEQIHSYCSMVCSAWYTARRVGNGHCSRNHECHRLKRCWGVHSGHSWMLRKSRNSCA
jgi:hypothetical protein